MTSHERYRLARDRRPDDVGMPGSSLAQSVSPSVTRSMFQDVGQEPIRSSRGYGNTFLDPGTPLLGGELIGVGSGPIRSFCIRSMNEGEEIQSRPV